MPEETSNFWSGIGDIDEKKIDLTSGEAISVFPDGTKETQQDFTSGQYLPVFPDATKENEIDFTPYDGGNLVLQTSVNIGSGAMIEKAILNVVRPPSRTEIIRRNIEAMTPATRADRLHRLEHQITRDPYEEIEYKVLGKIDINEKSTESDYRQKLHDEKLSNQSNFVFNIESNFELWRSPSPLSFLRQDDLCGSSSLRSNQKISVWVGNKVIMDGVYVDENGNQHTGRGNLDDYQIRDKNKYWNPEKWDDVMLRSQINSSDGVYLTKDLKKLKDFEMNKTENHPVAIGKVDRYFDTIGMDIGHRILTEQKFRNADGNLKSTSDVNKLLDEEYYKGEFGARGLPTLEGMRSAVQETKKIPLLTTPNFGTENPVKKTNWTLDNPKPPNTNTHTNLVSIDYSFTAGLDYSVTFMKDDYGNVWVGESRGFGVAVIPAKVGFTVSTGTTFGKHNSAEEVKDDLGRFLYSKYGSFELGPGWKGESGLLDFNSSNTVGKTLWRTNGVVIPNASVKSGISTMTWAGRGDEGIRNAMYLGKRKSFGIVDLSFDFLKNTLDGFNNLVEDNVEHVLE